MISLSRARFAAEMYWRRSLPLKHQSVDGSHKSKRERIVCAVRGWLPTLKHLPANARFQRPWQRPSAAARRAGSQESYTISPVRAFVERSILAAFVREETENRTALLETEASPAETASGMLRPSFGG